MNVYDEYVKGANDSDGPAGQQQPNGTENLNPSVEDAKDPEA